MSPCDGPPPDVTQEIVDNCLCLGVQRASRAVGRKFDEALRPLGLTNWQFSMLITLHRPTPLTVGQLAALLVMDRTTTTANLKPLERRGLVAVRRDADDARARRIVLTDAGRTLLDEAARRWQDTFSHLRAQVEPMDLDALRAALRAMARL